MELFFRKYFWTVTALFILLAAFIVARTVNVFVESAIAPLPTGAVARAQRAKATPARATLDLERLSKLTGLKISQPEVAVQAPTQAAYDPNAAPVKSGLRVKLLGTLVASQPQWSFASIQDMGTQRSQTYMVGDTVQGAEVREIERERVIVLNNNRREYIDGQPGDGSSLPTNTPVVAPVAVNTAAPTGTLGSGIRATSENDYEVPRPEIDNALNNLNNLAMQARIVPAFKDGQAQGFKLFSIRPDSLYSKIGVQNGDVIRRINGFEMNSPEKALEVYSKLKESSRIEIELERNGAPVKKTYNIR
ncbi:general secretion pathway protein GspC [Aggregicoccus sp. 17bor-14]|uniref:type II secretion system protein GspC n=1 Tax=Myxococcaceae TaxID=31 RepID=UPI00129D1084|nr:MULTISPECIES: type II secretion system protein GspC [Myxococcaceae]MBF5044912.1 general secretion pathway protein GspC [Simulacricoccus sp. 17bor-14]MRI90655.1 general secretion pathway protein GspC [Aggregicoccus sp. 17bor-14]